MKVIELLALLAAREYSRLEQICNGVRLSAAELQFAVSEYGCELISFPETEAHLIDCVEVTGSQPRAWSIWAPVFTAEEGRSDLTLQMTLTESPSGQYAVELDNLLVP